MKSMHSRNLLIICFCLVSASSLQAELRVGAIKQDVTPPVLPVIVNGGVLTRSIDTINTPISARVVILDDGSERIGIAVVDSCMLPRPLLDDIKHLIAGRTKLKSNRILISATHTHSAPSCMAALGTDPDETYVAFLREKVVEAFVACEKNLEPAQVGWGLTQAPEYTAIRRWIRRPDRVDLDPFGNPTVRANMHAAGNWDNVTGPSGPEDPDLSVISFQSLDGRPIALIANFSMHYFSDKAISADYFGLFSEGMKAKLAAEDSDSHPPFVAMMSHGCSGDIWRRDYAQPPEERNDKISIQEFSDGMIKHAMTAYESIDYAADADLAMEEARFELNYRVPDKQRLEWANRIVAEMGDRSPKTREEVYAREAVVMHDLQKTEVVVQALRIGDIGIVTTPNETYALTGLKLKLQSPLEKTMVIELANGGDGYIPPPEQHVLGGYNTWAARSAGLEVTAEPKIVQAGLSLLEDVSNKPRRAYQPVLIPRVRGLLESKPLALWRMDEMAGPVAIDTSGNGHAATYEPGTVFFVDGFSSKDNTRETAPNRAVHFAGGRMQAVNPGIHETFSISMWVWNGMPTDARDVTGWMFSIGPDFGLGKNSLHLGLGGKENHAGKLILLRGANAENIVAGKTSIDRWEWNHVAIQYDGKQVSVCLNGVEELTAKIDHFTFPTSNRFFFGGRSDNNSNWEGRLDEIVIFDRVHK